MNNNVYNPTTQATQDHQRVIPSQSKPIHLNHYNHITVNTDKLERVGLGSISSMGNDSNEQCELKYALTPIVLRTFYPDDAAEYSDSDDVESMVRAELMAIIDEDALEYLKSIKIEIQSVSHKDKYNITFDEYSFDNILGDDRLVTFVGLISNDSAHNMSSDFTISELLRLIGCSDADLILNKCEYVTNITFVFINNDNETTNCISTVLNYTFDISKEIKHFASIDFQFVGFVTIDTGLDNDNKNLACQDEFGARSRGMRYNDMIAANKDDIFMQSLPNLNQLQHAICAKQVKMDDKEYENQIIGNKWPKDMSHFYQISNEKKCYLPCIKDYKNSYAFVPTYYVI